jgi:hypothetical protein
MGVDPQVTVNALGQIVSDDPPRCERCNRRPAEWLYGVADGDYRLLCGDCRSRARRAAPGLS